MDAKYIEIERPVKGELTTRLHNRNNNNKIKTYKQHVAIFKKRPTLLPMSSERMSFGAMKSKHITRRNRNRSRSRSRNRSGNRK
jgi:hypothetical protein